MLKEVLLGLLDAEPRYGYELKAVFEQVTGGTWPLNVAQVYTALTKAEKDGLVHAEVVPQDLLPDRKVFALTDKGRAALHAWTAEPDTGPVRLRDEFFLKICVLTLTDHAAAAALVHRQRDAHLAALAALGDTTDRRTLHPATELLLEAAALRLEADLRWLDHAEARLKQ